MIWGLMEGFRSCYNNGEETTGMMLSDFIGSLKNTNDCSYLLDCLFL